MADEMTAVVTPEAPQAPKPPVKKGAAKKKKMIKRIITLVVVLALLLGGGFALYRFLFSTDGEAQGEIYAMPAAIGTIQSKVSGSGNAKAKKTESVNIPAASTVQDVFVTGGQQVMMGDPLFTIFSQAAIDDANKAQEAYDAQLKELQKLYEEQGNLTLRAPHAGKLMNVKELKDGNLLSNGEKVGELVNDTKLKLSLYYSYAYEGQISVGQSVDVSVPAVMATLPGRVDAINMVRYVVPEGGVCFEVVIALDNPGTLTEGMSVSASMTAADGTAIYPYQNGELKFYEVTDLIAKAGGPVLSSGLLNYADVSAGQTLVTMGGDDVDSRISAKMEQVKAAEDTLAEKRKVLDTFNAVAPISGTVISCSLTPGEEVGEARTAVIISDNTTMLVTINVDDKNIAFIKPGDMVELNWQGMTYIGNVTTIDMGGAQAGQGMTNYPVSLSVDNFDGSLMDGAWLQYSFVTSQSDDCILVPASAVQYFSDMDGNRQAVVFVQRDERPDDVPELQFPTAEPGMKRLFPSEDEGYYPVIVETGIGDPQNVEIVSGVSEGDMVFVNYTVTDGSYM